MIREEEIPCSNLRVRNANDKKVRREKDGKGM